VTVRYTRRALSDLSQILDYVDERSPGGALNVKLAIKHAINAIGENPGIGRPTGKGGTRGMPVGRYPYLIYWTVTAGEVRIIHVRHGARKPWKG
jgi:plasmid stabilization system protein ParE